MPFTHIFNVGGSPAASLPLYWNEEGLPIGVQVIADLYADRTAIAAARDIHDAAGGAQ